MKVLFVSSGNNKKFPIAPFIKSQGDSLIKQGIVVEYFTIKGKGIAGYLKNLPHLRKRIKKNKYDIVHAHYGFCGIVSCLAAKNEKVIISFMGDDLIGSINSRGNYSFISRLYVFLNRIITLFKYDFIIVKSKPLYSKILRVKNVEVVPNGVDFDLFKTILKDKAREILSIPLDKKVVLFAGNPARTVKNYSLAQKAVNSINSSAITLMSLTNTPFESVPIFYYAADVTISTSFHEGSPNVIKEAMACNCPIVSTEVGDVKWIFGNTEGCYLTSFNPIDVSEKIQKALDFAKNKGRTNGRNRIIALGLDTDSVAKKIIHVYQNVLEKKNVWHLWNYKSK
jgi:glycosyltransferase involved in cell wall biosynthesis